MKKILFVLIIPLFLLGCQEEAQLIKETNVVLVPSRSLDNCPVIKQFPDPSTLTDSQVAKLLVVLQHNNVLCRKTIDQIYNYLESAKKKVSSK